MQTFMSAEEKEKERKREPRLDAAAFESSRRRRYFDWANGAKYLAKYLHDKYVCPVTEILLSELMEAGAKRSVLPLFLPLSFSSPPSRIPWGKFRMWINFYFLPWANFAESYIFAKCLLNTPRYYPFVL